jgi:hypothetical protein
VYFFAIIIKIKINLHMVEVTLADFGYLHVVEVTKVILFRSFDIFTPKDL